MRNKSFILISFFVISVFAVFFWLNNKTPSSNEAALSRVGFWVKGSVGAKSTLVEYSDFQCSACGAYYPIIKKLNQELGDKVQFSYRHFPLRQHANAESAALAAEAAGRQGKFWEMHDIIFENQSEWSNSRNAKEKFAQYASTIGLDAEQFRQDFDSKELKDIVENDYKSGVRFRVNATPTFFLNGKKIQNPRTYEEFKSLIEND